MANPDRTEALDEMALAAQQEAAGYIDESYLEQLSREEIVARSRKLHIFWDEALQHRRYEEAENYLSSADDMLNYLAVHSAEKASK